MNKYDKIQCRMGDNKKLQEMTSSLISVFHPFANICLCSVILINIRFIIIQFQVIEK